MRLLKIVAVLSLFAGAATLRADSVTNYTVNGTLTNGAQVVGELVFDATDYVSSSFSFSVTLNGMSTVYDYNLMGAYAQSSGSRTESFYQFGDMSQPYFTELAFIGYAPLPTAPFCVDGTSGCIRASDVYPTSSTSIDFASGTVTPVTATPEPSSLALLGTGVLGVFGAARRRWNTARG